MRRPRAVMLSTAWAPGLPDPAFLERFISVSRGGEPDRGLPARLYYWLDTACVIELLTEHADRDTGASQAEVREGMPAAGEDSDGREEIGGTGMVDSRHEAGGAAADKPVEKPPSSWRDFRQQAGRNPANKPAGFPHASRRDSRQHAETTREHSSQDGTEKTAATTATAAAGSSDVICSVHGAPKHLVTMGWTVHRTSWTRVRRRGILAGVVLLKIIGWPA